MRILMVSVLMLLAAGCGPSEDIVEPELWAVDAVLNYGERSNYSVGGERQAPIVVDLVVGDTAWVNVSYRDYEGGITWNCFDGGEPYRLSWTPDDPDLDGTVRISYQQTQRSEHDFGAFLMARTPGEGRLMVESFCVDPASRTWDLMFFRVTG